MRKRALVVKISIIFLAVLFLASACSTPGGAQAGKYPNAQASTATPIPTSSQDVTAAEYFKCYNAIKLGMTIDEVNQATGLEPTQGINGLYSYDGGSCFGFLVFCDKNGKVFNKILCFTVKVNLSPLTPKPVTKAQCDQIKKGMTHADVVKLLGEDGVECGASIKGRELFWFNADGTEFSVCFAQDDTVVRTYDLAKPPD